MEQGQNGKKGNNASLNIGRVAFFTVLAVFLVGISQVGSFTQFGEYEYHFIAQEGEHEWILDFSDPEGWRYTPGGKELDFDSVAMSGSDGQTLTVSLPPIEEGAYFGILESRLLLNEAGTYQVTVNVVSNYVGGKEVCLVGVENSLQPRMFERIGESKFVIEIDAAPEDEAIWIRLLGGNSGGAREQAAEYVFGAVKVEKISE